MSRDGFWPRDLVFRWMFESGNTPVRMLSRLTRCNSRLSEIVQTSTMFCFFFLDPYTSLSMHFCSRWHFCTLVPIHAAPASRASQRLAFAAFSQTFSFFFFFDDNDLPQLADRFQTLVGFQEPNPALPVQIIFLRAQVCKSMTSMETKKNKIKIIIR